MKIVIDDERIEYCLIGEDGDELGHIFLNKEGIFFLPHYLKRHSLEEIGEIYELMKKLKSSKIKR